MLLSFKNLLRFYWWFRWFLLLFCIRYCENFRLFILSFYFIDFILCSFLLFIIKFMRIFLTCLIFIPSLINSSHIVLISPRVITKQWKSKQNCHWANYYDSDGIKNELFTWLYFLLSFNLLFVIYLLSMF